MLSEKRTVPATTDRDKKTIGQRISRDLLRNRGVCVRLSEVSLTKSITFVAGYEVQTQANNASMTA
jgi:hypothetical protein